MPSSRRELLRLGCLLALGANASSPPLALATQDENTREESARAIESALIAPCCFTQTVAHHFSPQSEAVKKEVRELLAQGWKEDRIVDAFVERYGERILAAPKASGFGMLAYVAPPLFVALGAVVVGLWIRSHRSDPPSEARARELLAEADPAHISELRAELARLDR